MKLRDAVSVRAAYAFGDWPPPLPRPEQLEQVAAGELLELSAFLEDVQGTFRPDERGACRNCQLVIVYHDATTDPPRCSELALRASWGDQ